ncbi:MAG: preprotein translocase subunit SecG [Gammaproteobacteria bacterium]|nr:preprotein translocase subunit SecG [Gammaproteobacteria bacterium]MDH3769239.1 preprotein translocase subunit SecG [Gammaproteobacteria bacterium]
MNTAVSISHVLLSVALITLILIQRGKGAEAGAAFGSGASGTVFGSAGSGSFLTRLTGVLATLFFATSLSLAYLAGKVVPTSVLEQSIENVAVEEVTPDFLPLPDDLPDQLPALPEQILPEEPQDNVEPEPQ